MFRPFQFPLGIWILSFMWISIEVRLIIFLCRYQGWVCVRKAGEGAEQRLKKIISFSSLSYQRCQPSLSPLSHMKVDFSPQWQRWKQIVGWGQKSADEGRVRQHNGFTAVSRSCSTSISSALGDSCPLSFLPASPFCTFTFTSLSLLYWVNW